MHYVDQNSAASEEASPEKMSCPKCGFRQQEAPDCLKCGIVFAKYDADQLQAQHGTAEPSLSQEMESADRWIGGAGKAAVIGLMSLFFFYMVIQGSGWCFLDYVNLPFHETGHILFRPFGETLSFLGGTISQLMWPAILAGYFLRRKELLSTLFCLFWFGENFLNISKYMADARSMTLPLVGGGIHDWNFLFNKWDILKYDHSIARVVYAAGVVIMAASIIAAFFMKPRVKSGWNS